MSERQIAPDFEERLRRAVRSYSSEGVQGYDPARISAQARSADAGVRGWWSKGRALRFVEPRVLRFVLLAGLLGVAVAFALAGSRQADPPFPVPGLLAVGLSDQIVVGDPSSGALKAITAKTAHDSYPVWSPDGTRLAFSQHDGRGPIRVADADGGNRRPLVDGMAGGEPAAWSSDGTRIAFVGYRYPGGAEEGLYVVGADGTNPTLLVPGGLGVGRLAWSPDDSMIAFVAWRDDGPAVGDGAYVHVVDVASGVVTIVSRSHVDSSLSGAVPLAWRPGRMELMYAERFDQAGAPPRQDIVLAERLGDTWQERALVTDLHRDAVTSPMWLDGERFVFLRDSLLLVAGADGTVGRAFEDTLINPVAPGCVAPDGSAVALPVAVPGTPERDELVILYTDGRATLRITTGGWVDRNAPACSWQALRP